ncbi:MAG: tetratricopeptide repeat protein [Caldisericum sp.]|uniref:tetratricopeptide repeat protein n=1 Tax=Caldisericum sp. TaxID=2499687 RepID=UPI003D0C1123
MKDYEIIGRLQEIKERLNSRPYAPILNILFLTYHLMLKNYDIVETHAETLSMDSPTPSTFYELFRGISYLIKGKDIDANIAFKYVLNIDPENQYGYLFKGIINLKEGKIAKELFDKAIVLAPKYEKEIIKEITNAEENEKLKIILSEENISRKEFINILEELDKSAKFDPIIKTTLAEAYLRAGEYKKVPPILENVLVNYPNYPRALYLMGRMIDEYLGNHEKANDYFKKIIEINPLCRFAVVPIEEDKLLKMDELNELKNLYKIEMPVIKFFKEEFEKLVEKPQVQEKAQKEEPQKTKPKEAEINKNNVDDSQKEKNQSDIDELYAGINLLKEKKYEEALKFFLNKLKESQNKEK